MRILHLVDRLDGRGGAYTHLRSVAAAQADAGHDVVVAGGRAASEPWPGTVRTVVGLEERTRSPSTVDALHGELAPDLVHLHTVVNPTVLEWAAVQRAVITVQDHRYFCPARGKWTLAGEPCREPLDHGRCTACFEDQGYFDGVWKLTRERLEALRRLTVVVLSQYMRRELAAAGLDDSRVHVVPPFVPGLEDAAEPGAPAYVLFAARLVEAKGVRDAVAAWRRSGLGLPLVMAGSGPMREWARHAGAEVLGWVPRERMGAVYRRAAVLVMPPRWQEPFGIAGLEALALGVPVAAWACGGIPEWHPGDASLAAWGDVGGLATALAWAAGRRATVPEGFTREATMRRLEAAYAAAAAPSPSPSPGL